MLFSILVQIIGAIGYFSLSISYFKEEKKQILFIQIISYIFFTIHYYLLSGITGAICNFIGLLALITIYFFNKYKLKNIYVATMFFVALIIIINIMTFQNAFSIFPMIGSVSVIISFIEDDENLIRGIGVIAAVCWLLYAIAYKSYIAIIFEVLTLINVYIAMMKKNKK